MEWQVRIEGHSKKRILVTFDPQGEIILFQGQYSIKNHWIDFSCETHAMEIDLETIQSLIGKVYDTMNKRLEVYEDLNKSFGLIKEIKIQGEDLVPTAIVTDNSVYGSPIVTVDGWNIGVPPK